MILRVSVVVMNCLREQYEWFTDMGLHNVYFSSHIYDKISLLFVESLDSLFLVAWKFLFTRWVNLPLSVCTKKIIFTENSTAPGFGGSFYVKMEFKNFPSGNCSNRRFFLAYVWHVSTFLTCIVVKPKVKENESWI